MLNQISFETPQQLTPITYPLVVGDFIPAQWLNLAILLCERVQGAQISLCLALNVTQKFSEMLRLRGSCNKLAYETRDYMTAVLWVGKHPDTHTDIATYRQNPPRGLIS